MFALIERAKIMGPGYDRPDFAVGEYFKNQIVLKNHFINFLWKNLKRRLIDED